MEDGVAYCMGCGRTLGECDGSCRDPLDPPRFCPRCGRKLSVQVSPTSFAAECRVHGPPELTTGH